MPLLCRTTNVNTWSRPRSGAWDRERWLDSESCSGRPRHVRPVSRAFEVRLAPRHLACWTPHLGFASRILLVLEACASEFDVSPSHTIFAFRTLRLPRAAPPRRRCCATLGSTEHTVPAGRPERFDNRLPNIFQQCATSRKRPSYRALCGRWLAGSTWHFGEPLSRVPASVSQTIQHVPLTRSAHLVSDETAHCSVA